MAYYLKGIGDEVTGKNEITPQFDAKINNFFAGMAPCVISSEENKFTITKIDRGVTIGQGLAFAYGYFGMSDSVTQFNFIAPSSGVQYAKIYAEFDLSKTPQLFSIKATPQSSSSTINLLNDNISEMPSGVFQLPLYLIRINASGTITFDDLRKMNSLCYPLGTLTNWSSGDECGSGSALLICDRYYVDGKRGLMLQYIERVGNSNQAQSEVSLIEIYGVT